MANVTVIVDCSTGTTDLKRTLKSLAGQSFANLNVLVVAPPDAKEAVAKAFPAGDARFAVELQGCAPSDVVERYSADAYVFCTCGTVYSVAAVENLFGTLQTKRADAVVGRGDVRLFDCYEKFMYAYRQQPVIDLFRKNSYNCRESASAGNLVATKGLLDYVPTDNKVFSRQTVLENIALLEDFGTVSRWQFCVAATLGAKAIYGVDAQAGRYRRVLQDSTPFATAEDVKRVLTAFDVARELVRGADYLSCSDASYQNDEDAAFRMDYLRRWLNCYELCALLRLWAFWYWEQGEDAAALCEERMRAIAAHAPEQWIDRCLADRPDLFSYFIDMREGRKLKVAASVAFVVLPGMSADRARAHLNQLRRQECPYLEVVLPQGQPWTDELAACAKNVRVVPFEGGSVGNWMTSLVNGTLKNKYVVFLQDRIYWTGSSVTRALRYMETQNFDCISARPMAKKETSLKVFEIAMPAVAENHVEEPLYALDSSLNNKMFRIDGLKSKHFQFTDDPYANTLGIYGNLACRQLPSIRLLCAEEADRFLGRVPRSIRLKYKLAYRKADRALLKAYKVKSEEIILNKPSNVGNQILFTTNRATGTLSPHLQALYDAMPGEKVILSQSTPHTKAFQEKLAKEICRSKVIITDDYVHQIKGIRLADNQRLYQVWHAIGAFKKFGLDCYGMKAANERACHEQYANVFVSSEEVRGIYASAFGVPIERVLALGSPNTDRLCDGRFVQRCKDGFKERHPEAAGKRIIAYCPTFRQNLRRVVSWDPGVDWQALNGKLQDMGAMLYVKPHPLDDGTFGVLAENPYEAIRLAAGEDVDELIAASDLMVTDYSSVVFDAALMDKPFVLYCPDFDSYQRDYYLDFPSELPAPMAKTHGELLEALENTQESVSTPAYADFKKKYLGACDGHSAERIAKHIAEQI